MASIPTITAPSRPSGPFRVADAVRVGFFGLAILVLELALAHGVAKPEVSRYVFLFMGLFVIAFVFRFPMATALVFFALTDFIFSADYFARPVGSIMVKPHEVALACLLAVAIVRPKARTWGGTTGLALAAFLGLAGVSDAIAISAGHVGVSEAFNWYRPLGLLTIFYVIVRLFPSAEERRFLLTGAAVLAGFTGVVALIVSLGGSFPPSIEAEGNTVTSEGIGSIQRVRLTGLSMGYALFWFTAVKMALGRGWPRIAWGAILLGITIDIAVSFNRNMWLGLFIGALLMVVFGGALVRHRLAVGAAVAVAGLAMLMVFGSSSTSSQVVQPIVKRGATIFNPGKTSKESSLQDREHETKAAWKTAQGNLVIGIGAGVPFGFYDEQPISTGSFTIGTTRIPQLFLHNQYLYLVLVAGIPGLIAFLIFLGMPISYALKRSRQDPALIALAVGIATIMVSAIVAIYFTVDDMTAALGLLAGVIVADRLGPAERDEPSGLIS